MNINYKGLTDESRDKMTFYISKQKDFIVLLFIYLFILLEKLSFQAYFLRLS